MRILYGEGDTFGKKYPLPHSRTNAKRIDFSCSTLKELFSLILKNFLVSLVSKLKNNIILKKAVFIMIIIPFLLTHLGMLVACDIKDIGRNIKKTCHYDNTNSSTEKSSYSHIKTLNFNYNMANIFPCVS